MLTCIIFCAGEFRELAEPVGTGDYILAADGGLAHSQRLGLQPNGIIGDFDSLGYVPTGATVFPVEKDDTDSMLAIRQGLALGYRRFVLYGALDGPRLDHTVANLQALQYLADQGAEGYLSGVDTLVTVVKNGKLSFPDTAEGIVSVFCMGPNATGVTLKGLQYPLTDGTLTASMPLGVSNHFIGEKSTISVKNGTLLVFSPIKNGFPEVSLC